MTSRDGNSELEILLRKCLLMDILGMENIVKDALERKRNKRLGKIKVDKINEYTGTIAKSEFSKSENETEILKVHNKSDMYDKKEEGQIPDCQKNYSEEKGQDMIFITESSKAYKDSKENVSEPKDSSLLQTSWSQSDVSSPECDEAVLEMQITPKSDKKMITLSNRSKKPIKQALYKNLQPKNIIHDLKYSHALNVPSMSIHVEDLSPIKKCIKTQEEARKG